jgi:apolipoprotein D and lipocalin family protein
MSVKTVPYVDLKKYAGLWYEIASYPNRFQKGCINSTAEYTLTDKGYVIVENRCDRESGMRTYIKGKAFVVKDSGNAKLKVQFFWPFRGDYWIIDLADDYSYAVVGHPSRKYLWILSRSPIISENLFHRLLSRIEAQGYDLGKVAMTRVD